MFTRRLVAWVFTVDSLIKVKKNTWEQPKIFNWQTDENCDIFIKGHAIQQLISKLLICTTLMNFKNITLNRRSQAWNFWKGKAALTKIRYMFSTGPAEWKEIVCQVQFSSVTWSWPTLCDPMDWSTSAPSSTPRSYSNSCPSSQWCHPTISSSVIPFSCLQSFPASESFPMSQFFTSGGQSIGVSASASVLLMSIQDWFPLGLTGWISLQSKGSSRVFSNNAVLKHQFFRAQLSF